MNTGRRRLVGGRPEGRTRRWLTLVGGYAAVVAVGTAYRLHSPPESVAPVLYEDPLITALLLGSFAAAAAVVGAVAGVLGAGVGSAVHG